LGRRTLVEGEGIVEELEVRSKKKSQGSGTGTVRGKKQGRRKSIAMGSPGSGSRLRGRLPSFLSRSVVSRVVPVPDL
jgi:hypothetical protein